jgi:hypothetical protein
MKLIIGAAETSQDGWIYPWGLMIEIKEVN